MNAILSRSTVKSRALPWLFLLCLPALAFVLFSVSEGVAMVAVFTVLLTVVITASVVLIRSKLAFQRGQRSLLLTGSSR